MKDIPPTRPMPSPDRRLILGRYQVCQILGRGAMGEVFEAYDIQSETSVAIKHVTPEYARDPECIRQIRKNFSLASQLTHQHIASLRHLQADTENGQYYVIMDLVRGRDLGQWATGKRNESSDKTLRWRGTQGRHDPGAGKDAGTNDAGLPVELVVGIAEQIASALDYAHSQPISRGPHGATKTYGILHRDLKPTNVMVETEREYRPGIPFVRLVDFGLAAEIQASLDGRSLSNVKNEVTGTPHFMAPEQFLGRALTRGLDQWALAVIMYEMLTGRLPFPGPSIPLVQAQVLACDPETPPHLSSGQWAELKRTFQRDRRLRHPSCMALVRAFADADARTTGQVIAPISVLPDELMGITDTAQAVSPVEPEPTRNPRVPKAALVAILLLGVLAGAIALVVRPKGSEQSDPPQPAQPATPSTEKQRTEAKKDVPAEAKKKTTNTKEEPGPSPKPESGKTKTDSTPKSEKKTPPPAEKTVTVDTVLEDLTRQTERLRTSAWPWNDQTATALQTIIESVKYQFPGKTDIDSVRVAENILKLRETVTASIKRETAEGNRRDLKDMMVDWRNILTSAQDLGATGIRAEADDRLRRFEKLAALRVEMLQLGKRDLGWAKRNEKQLVEDWKKLADKAQDLGAGSEHSEAITKARFYEKSCDLRMALTKARDQEQRYQDLPQENLSGRRDLLAAVDAAWRELEEARKIAPNVQEINEELNRWRDRRKALDASLRMDDRRAEARLKVQDGLRRIEDAIAGEEKKSPRERNYSTAQEILHDLESLVDTEDAANSLPEDMRADTAQQVLNAKLRVGTLWAEAIHRAFNQPQEKRDWETLEWRAQLALQLLSAKGENTETAKLKTLMESLSIFDVPAPSDALLAIEAPDPGETLRRLKVFVAGAGLSHYRKIIDESNLGGEMSAEQKIEKVERGLDSLGKCLRLYSLGFPLGEVGCSLRSKDYAFVRSPDAWIYRVYPPEEAEKPETKRDPVFKYRIELVAFEKGDALDSSRTIRRDRTDLTMTMRMAEAYRRANIVSDDLSRQVDRIGLRAHIEDDAGNEVLQIDGRLWPEQHSKLAKRLSRRPNIWSWDTVRPVSAAALLVITTEPQNTALEYIVRTVLRGGFWDIGVPDQTRKDLDKSVSTLLSYCGPQITFAIDRDTKGEEVICIVSGATKDLDDLSNTTTAKGWAEKLKLAGIDPNPEMFNQSIVDEATKKAFPASGLSFRYKNRDLVLCHMGACGMHMIVVGQRDCITRWLNESLPRLSRGVQDQTAEFAAVLPSSVPRDVGSWAVVNPSPIVKEKADLLWATSSQSGGLASFRLRASAQSVESLKNALQEYQQGKSRCDSWLAPELHSLFEVFSGLGNATKSPDRPPFPPVSKQTPSEADARLIEKRFLPLAIALTVSKGEAKKKAEEAGGLSAGLPADEVSEQDMEILGLLTEACRSPKAEGLEQRVRGLRIRMAKDMKAAPWREAIVDILLANVVGYGGSAELALQHATGGIDILEQSTGVKKETVDDPKNPVHQLYVLLKCLQVRCAFKSPEMEAKFDGSQKKALAKGYLDKHGFKESLPLGDKLSGCVDRASNWSW